MYRVTVSRSSWRAGSAVSGGVEIEPGEHGGGRLGGPRATGGTMADGGVHPRGRGSPVGPELEVRVGGGLAGGMDRDATPGRPDRLAGLAEGELGPIALLAEMEQDQVPDLLPAGAVQDRADQLGSLPVREVAPISEIPRDQGRGAARGLLHRHVVVELDPQDIHVAKAIGHRVSPAPGVGQVADGKGPGAATGDAFDPESVGRAAVVPQG